MGFHGYIVIMEKKRWIYFSSKKVAVYVVVALMFGMIILPVHGGKNQRRASRRNQRGRNRWRGRSNQNEIRTGNNGNQRFKKGKDQTKRPHIIYILADDLGWNDVGYHGSEIDTPVIDALAKEGVRLENYYSQAVCSPTRASLMTGRYQSRTGIDRILDASEVGCMPVHLTTLPERLKVYGYSTHLVGKWHLGFSRKACLPTRRGFDSFLGPYTGYTDHFTRMKVATIGNRTYDGYDFHKDEQPSYLYGDKYSTHVYTQEAEKIIKKYSRREKPLFLFLSLQAPHTPNQAPKYYFRTYKNRIQDKMRLSHAAMTTCMDTAIGRIHEALLKYNMWQNTVLIFSSDNGGVPQFGADNTPLRGSKGNYREGGIRVPAFITSPLLSQASGSIYAGLMGAADWLPTLVDGVAGGSTKYLAVDGINMWDNIRTGFPSQRIEYLFTVGGDCNWEPGDEVKDIPMYGTIRVGVWKLILGHISQKPVRIVKQAADNHEIRLYNLALDPSESKNLYTSHYFIFYSLLQRLRHHCRTRLPYVPLEESELSHPKLHGGVFQPWLDHREISGA
ncbi:arylsulfatase J-like [Amphiura filiformis]|uniref:arylsulfatase J-like n=1 Tax=Amphiura filiformis TaxID=82378 RepID=UPI003B22144E